MREKEVSTQSARNKVVCNFGVALTLLCQELLMRAQSRVLMLHVGDGKGGTVILVSTSDPVSVTVATVANVTGEPSPRGSPSHSVIYAV